MNIITQAIVISENNYNLAVACLPAGFAIIPRHKVYGYLLIINDLVAVGKGKKRPTLAIDNLWISVADFERRYISFGELVDTQFVEVERV